MTDEDAAGFVEEVRLATVSSSTFHRVSRAIAAQYEAKRAVIETAIREQAEIPASAVTVQAGIDGVTVPQDGQHAMEDGETLAKAIAEQLCGCCSWPCCSRRARASG